MNIVKKAVFAFPLLLNTMVKRTNWYNNVKLAKGNYPDNDWYRTHFERNYDVVNLGSSSALYGFDYTGLGVKAFNWASQPQSLEYSFKILKCYFSILRQKGIVLIPFSPFTGLSVTGKWAESAYDKYYGILDYTLIDNFERMRRRREYPLLSSPKTSLKRLIKDVPKKTSFRTCAKCKTVEQFKADADNWHKGWMKEFGIHDLDAPLSTENIEGANSRKKLLNEMIGFCLNRDLCPVIVMPPCHPALSKLFTPKFRENYIYSFIKSANVYEAPFLDYFDDERFVEDKDYDNAFFLSEEGARKFTKVVLTDIGVI